MVKKVDILRADSQARLYRSIALKMDYHLLLSLSIGYQTSARFLGRGAVAGQQIPWSNQGLGFECMLDLPVEPTSVSTSFLSEPHLKISERPDWLRIPGVVELSQIRSRVRQQVCGQGADRSTGNRT